MRHKLILKHEFVEYIPDDLKDGIIYVSIAFATVVHKCCCGCGKEVVTPLSPTDWRLVFDGRSISLYPSIGNWDFPCQSHYWVKGNRVEWAPRWSKEKINARRIYDTLAKRKYFESLMTPIVHDTIRNVKGQIKGKTKKSIWRKLKK